MDSNGTQPDLERAAEGMTELILIAEDPDLAAERDRRIREQIRAAGIDIDN